MSSWNHPLPYFTAAEVACKGTGVIRIDRRFALALMALRFLWGAAFTVSSLCRTPSHNTAVGGHPNSLHLTENPKHDTDGAMAADVPWAGWSEGDQLAFAQMAWGLGFSVGLNDAFCHIDYRKAIGLPQNVFTYGARWTGRITEDQIRGGA